MSRSSKSSSTTKDTKSSELSPHSKPRLELHFKPFLLVLIALSCAIFMSYLNYPYRPFPTDELWTYSVPLRGEDWMATGSEILLNSPVHIYILLAVKPFVLLAGLHWFQTFLVASAIALSVSACLLGMTVYTVTKQLSFSVGASLLFILSGWAQSYLHFYTYAPIACMLMMASLYFFVRFYSTDYSQSWLAGGAGFCAALFFLSSSSAKLLAALLIAAYVLLLYRAARPRRAVLLLVLISSALVPIVSLAPIYLTPLLSHLKTNVSAGNGIECLQKYGFLPTTPFFSFFYLLSVCSPALLLFLLASLGVTLVKWRTLVLSKAGVLVLLLFSLVLSHTVILDLLPFTKLGRTQFPLLPLTTITLTLLYASFPLGAVLGRRLFFMFLIIVLPLEIYASTQTWQARRSAPAYLEKLSPETVFFFLEEDPHCHFIANWLQSEKEFAIPLSDLPKTIQSRQNPIALIVGPTGRNSGKSVLKNSIMDDFSFAMPQNIGIMPSSIVTLPYYSHYPLFMMEEETSQCFYFRHQVPDYRSKESQLTVYYWPTPTASAGQDRKNK